MVERLAEIPKGVQELLEEAKEENLPKSIKAYIRRIKQEQGRDVGLWFREQLITKKAITRQEKAEKMLKETILKLIQTDDPAVQAKCEVRAIWLMFAAGILNSDERTQEIISILDSKGGQLKEELENNLPKIRDQVKFLLP